jgi:hypothetical protein
MQPGPQGITSCLGLGRHFGNRDHSPADGEPGEGGHRGSDQDNDPGTVEPGQVLCRAGAEHGHEDRHAQGRPELAGRGQDG